MLAKRLFSSHKRNAALGYFTHENMYIIYKLGDVAKGYVPAFKDVKDKVSEDFYEEKAESLAKNTLKETRAALMAKRMTFEQAAQSFKASIITTKKIKKGSPLKEFGDDVAVLRDRLLLLTSPVQVLEHKNKDTFFLAQINEITPASADFNKEIPKIIKQEKYKANTLSMSAFIASLYRNAKIEIDRKILETQHVDWKE